MTSKDIEVVTTLAKESVNHPAHYMDESGVECIDIIESMKFSSGNAFKYIYRAGKKGETVEDLQKSIFYLNHAAKKNEFNTMPLNIKELVERVAVTRHEYIGEAMRSIYYGEWNQAIVYINSYMDVLSRIDE